jgi:hypothetical protein
MTIFAVGQAERKPFRKNFFCLEISIWFYLALHCRLPGNGC